ncbi:MAG TPA: hypothetical protein VIK95_05590 [Egibacteraceae bacterium]
MQRASTTILVVIGDEAREAAEALGRGANVRALLPDEEEPFAAAREVQRGAATTRAPYVVTDVDPLAPVAAAWERYFDEQAPRGDLELAVADATARWRAGTLELPDYYLLVDADDWTPTRRHWFLGFLHRHGPARVVPAEASLESLQRAVSRLRAGRWWPRLPDLLADVEAAAPDDRRVATDDDVEGPRLLTREDTTRVPTP